MDGKKVNKEEPGQEREFLAFMKQVKYRLVISDNYFIVEWTHDPFFHDGATSIFKSVNVHTEETDVRGFLCNIIEDAFKSYGAKLVTVQQSPLQFIFKCSAQTPSSSLEDHVKRNLNHGDRKLSTNLIREDGHTARNTNGSGEETVTERPLSDASPQESAVMASAVTGITVMNAQNPNSQRLEDQRPDDALLKDALYPEANRIKAVQLNTTESGSLSSSETLYTSALERHGRQDTQRHVDSTETQSESSFSTWTVSNDSNTYLKDTSEQGGLDTYTCLDAEGATGGAQTTDDSGPLSTPQREFKESQLQMETVLLFDLSSSIPDKKRSKIIDAGRSFIDGIEQMAISPLLEENDEEKVAIVTTKNNPSNDIGLTLDYSELNECLDTLSFGGLTPIKDTIDRCCGVFNQSETPKDHLKSRRIIIFTDALFTTDAAPRSDPVRLREVDEEIRVMFPKELRRTLLLNGITSTIWVPASDQEDSNNYLNLLAEETDGNVIQIDEIDDLCKIYRREKCIHRVWNYMQESSADVLTVVKALGYQFEEKESELIVREVEKRIKCKKPERDRSEESHGSQGSTTSDFNI